MRFLLSVFLDKQPLRWVITTLHWRSSEEIANVQQRLTPLRNFTIIKVPGCKATLT